MTAPRTTVAILSPLAPRNGRTLGEHIAHAQKLCLAAVRAGYAPFASHAFYTFFLDDSILADRLAGTQSGVAWCLAAREVWIWDLWGISSGMSDEIEAIERENESRRKSGEEHRMIVIRHASRIACWQEFL